MVAPTIGVAFVAIFWLIVYLVDRVFSVSSELRYEDTVNMFLPIISWKHKMELII